MINSNISIITAHCTYWGMCRHLGREPCHHQQLPSHCHPCILIFVLLLKTWIFTAFDPGHLILHCSSLRVFSDIKIYLHNFPNFPHTHSVVCSCLLWDSSTSIFVNYLLLSTPKRPGLSHYLEFHILCAANSHLLIRGWADSWHVLIF